MKLQDVVDGIFVDPLKLTGYALCQDHPRGKHKALMFQKHLGYTPENYQPLLAQIYAKALTAEAIFKDTNQYGNSYQVDLEIQGMEPGQTETVRTGWLHPPNTRKAKLTSAYVRRTRS